MTGFSYRITDEVGIHARPAGLMMKKSLEYKSSIMVKCNGKTADVRKIMSVMALGVKKGDLVELVIEGEDEEEAKTGLEAFFQENL